MKRKQQKGTSKIALIVIVVVVLAVLGYALFSSRSATFVPSTQQTQTAIQNDSDLQYAAEDLDNTNVDSIDNELTQNDADASTF